MTNHEILEKAKELFPNMFSGDYIWFPHGKNSVRVKYDHREVIITYLGDRNWAIETPDFYFNRRKGEQKKQKGE